MAFLNLTIKHRAERSRKIVVEMDADRFEKLAANLGLFNPDFLKSLERAEREISQGKTKRLHSLHALRRT